jgi:glycosyltransferase involved in cell wall biosynthesis
VSERSLRIAWLGSPPADSGGAPGVVAELLEGLARRGHRIDCFFPSAERQVPPRFSEHENLNLVWGTAEWRWGRWYNRLKITAFATGLLARGMGALRLRREVVRRHRREPYDLIYQNSTIESLAVPRSLVRTVPLVIRPDTHIAGELRCLIAERRLAFACQPRYMFFTAAAIMSVRALVQRIRIQRASLVICISHVFRDHLVHDYRFPREATVVVANPVRLERFTDSQRPIGEPPAVLVLGRVSARKGVDDVIAVAKRLIELDVEVRIRVVGGPSLWSDYTSLLAELPQQNSEYVGRIPPARIPAELASSDLLLQASTYEPFGLTVAEALAAGVPVVATSQVGAIEGVERLVVAEVAPGDVEGMAGAVTAMLERLRASPAQTRTLAHKEAERLFATEVVCEQISDALEALVDGARANSAPAARSLKPGAAVDD